MVFLRSLMSARHYAKPEYRRFSPGTIDYDGAISTNYRRGRSLSSETAETWRSVIEPFVKTAQPPRILDLGAGIGRFSVLFAESFQALVIAMEPSRGMLAAAACTSSLSAPASAPIARLCSFLTRSLRKAWPLWKRQGPGNVSLVGCWKHWTCWYSNPLHEALPKTAAEADVNPVYLWLLCFSHLSRHRDKRTALAGSGRDESTQNEVFTVWVSREVARLLGAEVGEL